jgi:hypothetical protein
MKFTGYEGDPAMQPTPITVALAEAQQAGRVRIPRSARRLVRPARRLRRA